MAERILKVGGELGAALLLGFIVALIVNFLVRWAKAGAQTLALSLSALLLMIGVARVLDLDVILASMACGFVVRNMAPRRTEGLIRLLREFSSPVYVLFFVFVGARLAVHSFPPWLGAIVAVYVIGRTAGKMSGAWLGAKMTNSPAAVRRNLGMGLFAQGGVAVGLSVIATEHLQHIPAAGGLSLGDAVIFTVAATTLIVQILGPPTVKFAAHRAGEIGRDRTEDDILGAHKVKDWMTPHVPAVSQAEPLRAVIARFAKEEAQTLFVLDKDGRLQGRLTMEGMRDILPDPDAWDWMLAADILLPVREYALADESLAEAVRRMRQAGIEECVVIPRPDDTRPVGVLNLQHVRDMVKREMLVASGAVQEDAPANAQQAGATASA